jgi:NitT/TauT family transport system substrate-binding protein
MAKFKLSRRVVVGGLAAGALAAPRAVWAQVPRAEARTLRLAQQFGISYLSFPVMRERKLIEKHLETAGLKDIAIDWAQFSNGTVMNEAMISGNLDIAAGGIGPMITIWARTRGNLNVRALAALNSMPLYCNTINPNVRTIKDFTERDRIAMPTVKISIQAVVLQMEAEKVFGMGKHEQLDGLTVSLAHPDALTAMMSGRSEITAHFASAPFQEQELEDQRVRRVLNSYDVIGGPHTFNVAWASNRWREDNPRTASAFLAALEEANAFIARDPAAAVDIWIKAENSKLPPAFLIKLLTNGENVYTTTPQNTVRFAEFMQRTGAVREKPASWKDMFHPSVHDKPGN